MPDVISIEIAQSQLAHQIDEASKIAKGPSLFRREYDPEAMPEEIRILRRWNSHTPAMIDVWGGGYFMWWNQHGTVIDPGCSFIRLMDMCTPYGLGQVNMIITTHDHSDHCQDLGVLVSLLRGYNQWLTKQPDPKPKLHCWDMVMSHGVADLMAAVLTNPDNSPFLRWCRALGPRDLDTIHVLPKFVSRAAHTQFPKHIVQRIAHCQEKVGECLQYDLSVLPANHRELLSDHTSLGLRFVLKKPGQEPLTVVISGDTGINRDLGKTDGSELTKHYEGADLLILHVGSMEGPTETRPGEHLGLTGVTEILSRLRGGDRPKLVVLTEWGYEFGRVGLQGRSQFTALVERVLREKLNCRSYYSALPGATAVRGKTPIIPADVGLRISLPDLKVWSDARGKNGFVDMRKVRAQEIGEKILYR